MQIAKDTVVLFNYTMHAEGELLDDASQGTPVAILYGHGNVIRGLEKALLGHAPGDRIQADIPPVDAYGSVKPDAIQRFSKKYFAQGNKLKVGQQTTLRTRESQQLVTVVKVGGKVVDVDLNHPLAGKTLNFDIEIKEVRAATPSEIAHGHAHPDGHEHH